MYLALHSLNDIPAVLAQFAQDVRGALERAPAENERQALEQLLAWTLAHQRRFQAMAHRLNDGPDAALLRDWLAHAPALELPAQQPLADAPALQRRAAVLEGDLFLLIGQLLQHSGSGWVSELYRNLLDHRLAALAQPAPPPC